MKVPTAAMPDPARINGLDELRGLAVIAVMLSHLPPVLGGTSQLATLLWTPALGVGVDLFFVISGFVIFRQLQAIKARNRLRAIAGFWIRRVARIAPMAWVVAAITTSGLIVLPPAILAPGDILSAAFFVSNVHWASCFSGGTGCGSPAITGHFWSLATEMQFYILAPLLLLLPRNWLRLVVLLVLLVGASTTRPWGGGLWVLRIDALMLGVFLASEGIADRRAEEFLLLPPLSALEAIFWIVVAAILGRLASGAGSGAAIVAIALIFAMVVLRAVSPNSSLSHGVTGLMLRRVGALSFALYLVHLPIFSLVAALTRDSPGFEMKAILGLALTTFAAWALHQFVGEPCRAIGRRLAATIERQTRAVEPGAMIGAIKAPAPGA